VRIAAQTSATNGLTPEAISRIGKGGLKDADTQLMLGISFV
jgi:hypothetical protein